VEVGVLEGFAYVFEDLSGTVLEDLAHKVGVVVAVFELDGGHGVDGVREDRAVAELYLLGLRLRDLEPVGEVGGEVLTPYGDDGGMGERAL